MTTERKSERRTYDFCWRSDDNRAHRLGYSIPSRHISTLTCNFWVLSTIIEPILFSKPLTVGRMVKFFFEVLISLFTVLLLSERGSSFVIHPKKWTYQGHDIGFEVSSRVLGSSSNETEFVFDDNGRKKEPILLLNGFGEYFECNDFFSFWFTHSISHHFISWSVCLGF